eukprot:TRINITY_DN11720_c0_g1_i4.p1 TRINITY_DN11720_c0_g1~~TRINITY_DN11720_c0_g1_i4.p1  ORF type:complete len:152 (+),score=17.02 TRINITY_DN11720_c0_g1_i4:59-514(+)
MLRLEPRFDVVEKPDRYVITSYIPGMKQEDIGLSVGERDNTITITGIREPSKSEEEFMRNRLEQLQETAAKRYPHMPKPTEEQKEMILLQMGSGRYGRFSETYRLPRGIDLKDIVAAYENGILSVILPKQAVAKPLPGLADPTSTGQPIFW